MKLNNYIKMLIAGITMLGFTACVDDNDWGTDSSYSRLFRPDEITLTISATYIEMEFDILKDAEYYIAEINTDSLYLDEVYSTSRVDTITSSPYTMTGLSGETTYYLRVRAEAPSTGQVSNWTYYTDDDEYVSFTTDGEQILNDVENADRDDSSIRLSWEAGLDVTTIVVTCGGSTVQTITLTSSEIAAGECTVTGLEASTSYTFTIYNGTSKRGTITASTTAAMPSADYKVSLEEGVDLTQDLLDEYAVLAQEAAGSTTSYSLTIGLPADTEIGFYGIDEDTGNQTTLTIPDGMSVTFFGLPGASKPVVALPKTLDLAGTHAYVRFEGVTITDDGSQYLINQSDVTTTEELTFTDCEITGFSRSVFRLQGSNTLTVSTLNIDDCIVTYPSTSYDCLYFNADNFVVNEINITNSTFDFTSCTRSFICSSNCTALTDVNISYCTFYDVPNSTSRYFCDSNGMSTNVTMEGVLFGASGESLGKGVRSSGTVTTTDTYCASNAVFSGNTVSSIETLEVSTTDLFADPANGDFTVSQSAYKSFGDPRWNE